MKIDELSERLKYEFKCVKDFDPVEYCGGEMWKPHRRFSNFELSAEELGISEEMYEDFIRFQESAWMFCDTIIMENQAERGYHILDYALHGERMGWNVGDEYWLVVNCACDRGRLELRKADPEKWTPLEKFYVNRHLDIKLKIYVLPTLMSLIFNKKIGNKCSKKIVKKLGINSFPDRIELRIMDGYTISDVINYYNLHSSFKYYENGYNLAKYYDNLIYNEKYDKELKQYRKSGGFCRRYNIFNKEDEKENPEIYKNIFLKYCHDLHYRQKHLKDFQ